MNREIKFRAWNSNTNVMYYSDNDTTVWMGGLEVSVNSNTGKHKGKFIGMQYTGLPDKNGMEIYEGDILREPAKDKWEETNFMAYEVFFHDNDSCDSHIGFQCDRTHCFGVIAGGMIHVKFKPSWTNRLEIIGNIYQPPSDTK